MGLRIPVDVLGGRPRRACAQARVSRTARALIFSGRRDPTWPLSRHAQQALVALWLELQPAESSEGFPPTTLGYRGVEVLSEDGRSWVAAARIVTMVSADELSTRRDPQQVIERLVLSTAPEGLLPPGAVPWAS